MEGEQLQGNPTALPGRNEAAVSGLLRWLRVDEEGNPAVTSSAQVAAPTVDC